MPSAAGPRTRRRVTLRPAPAPPHLRWRAARVDRPAVHRCVGLAEARSMSTTSSASAPAGLRRVCGQSGSLELVAAVASLGWTEARVFLELRSRRAGHPEILACSGAGPLERTDKRPYVSTCRKGPDVRPRVGASQGGTFIVRHRPSPLRPTDPTYHYRRHRSRPQPGVMSAQSYRNCPDHTV